jgi:hypothetical protein
MTTNFPPPFLCQKKTSHWQNWCPTNKKLASSNTSGGLNAHVDNAKLPIVDPPKSPPCLPYFNCIPSCLRGNGVTGR